jgi:hypothetical protein
MSLSSFSRARKFDLTAKDAGSSTREFEWKYAGKNSERAREEENDDAT